MANSWLLRALILVLSGASILWLFSLLKNHNDEPSVFAPNQHGVKVYNSNKVSPGYNIITTWAEGEDCVIMSNDGKHSRSLPGLFCQFAPGYGLVTIIGSTVTLLDTHLKKKWSFPVPNAHHWMSIWPKNNEIFVIGREYTRGWKKNSVISDDSLIVSDVLIGLDFEGNEIFRWRVKDHVQKLEKALGEPIDFIKEPRDPRFDFQASHFNSIERIPKGYEHLGTQFQEGNLLVSESLMDRLYIINRKGEIVWTYHPERFYRGGTHSARWTDEGRVLYFKNNTKGEVPDTRDQENKSPAEIIELDPRNGHIFWSYKTKDPNKFTSGIKYGHVQKLENGNYLVSHNPDGGHAFEITQEREIIWEWATDQKDAEGRRLETYRIIRIPAKEIKDFEGFL